jgi:hypothetical protein
METMASSQHDTPGVLGAKALLRGAATIEASAFLLEMLKYVPHQADHDENAP